MAISLKVKDIRSWKITQMSIYYSKFTLYEGKIIDPWHLFTYDTNCILLITWRQIFWLVMIFWGSKAFLFIL